MTAVMFIVLGLFLCFLGAASIRFAILVAGCCGAWLLAPVFVAAAALLGGFLAQRWKQAFLVGRRRSPWSAGRSRRAAWTERRRAFTRNG
jgi:hypothetical protein